MADLADRVKEGRELRKLTQAQLAEAADVSLRNVSKIEQGQRPDLKLSTIQKLAEALGCSEEWLLYGTGEAPKKKVEEESPPESEPTPIPGRERRDTGAA